jgi:hypothetical protein
MRVARPSRANHLRRRAAVMAFTITLLGGCANWSRPADLMVVDLRSLPTNAISFEFAGDRDREFESIAFYSSLEEWHPAYGPAPLWGESSGVTELRWIKCDRYGFVARLPGRTWRVWWFDAGQLDTSSERVTIDLSVARESILVGDEFLHRIGIVSGQRSPGSWDRYSRDRPTDAIYWRKFAGHGMQNVSIAIDLLGNGKTDECREQVDLACLEVADEACSFAALGTDAQRRAVQNIYDAYATFESAIQSGDDGSARRALERMNVEFESLTPK